VIELLNYNEIKVCAGLS